MTLDSAALARIHVACFSRPRRWQAEKFEALLDAGNATLVAHHGGFVLARRAQDEAEILTIAVLPAGRRRGVGRGLMVELERMLAADGTGRLFLEVSEANAAALALFYRRGFSETGRRSGYCRDSAGPPQHALILSKTLI